MTAPAAPTPAASVGVAKTRENRAERGRDQGEQRQRSNGNLAQHDRQRVDAFLDRDRRPELGIIESARHQVDDVEAGQQEARTEGGGIEIGDRHAEHRAHHHQHDRRRDENPERPAGGDRARRQLSVIAGLDHDRRGHDPEHGDRRTDDAGRHREHGGGENDHEIERATHRREQQAKRREQPLHQAGLLGDETHEDEQRHRRQEFLLHHPDDLEIGEVEDRVAHAEIAERQGEEEQREGYRHADKDRSQEHHEHDQADECLAGHTSTFSLCSSSSPVRAMYRLLRSSEMPWISSSRQVSGTTALNGQRMGRQAVWSEVSLICQA